MNRGFLGRFASFLGSIRSYNLTTSLLRCFWKSMYQRRVAAIANRLVFCSTSASFSHIVTASSKFIPLNRGSTLEYLRAQRTFTNRRKSKDFESSQVQVRCVRFIPSKNWFVTRLDDFQLRIFNYNTNEKVIASRFSWIPICRARTKMIHSIIRSGAMHFVSVYRTQLVSRIMHSCIEHGVDDVAHSIMLFYP